MRTQSMMLNAHMADNELVQKIRNGDKECFELLMRRHTQALYRIGRMFGYDPLDVEDLLTDTHFAAFRHLSEQELKMPYRTWISGIMMDKCRQRERVLQGPVSTTVPAYTAAAPAAAKAENPVSADMDRLPVSLKTVFVLREVEGFSDAETAALLSIPEDHVRKEVREVKSSMPRTLRKHFFHPDVYPFTPATCDKVVKSVMRRINDGCCQASAQ